MFYTIAKDDLGNVSAKSGTYSINVDTVNNAPVITGSWDDVQGGVYNGLVGNGGVTNDRTLDLRGTAEPGSVVYIVIDNYGTVSGSVTAGADGKWSYPVATNYNMTYNFHAYSVDAAGMGKTQEMRTYGLESLMQSDQRFGHGKHWPLPTTAPRPFNASQPEKNIIAFSLYGDQPRYCETLIKNIEAATSLFPGWRCRVYLDNSVPQHVWQRLQAAGAQLVDMSHERGIYPTLWRFLVMDDPQVERFLVRDADSLLSEREQVCVEAWLGSPCYFHHMRDYFTHTELLLAGMWGGCGGVIPDVEGMMRDFVSRYKGSARFTDQYFLKAVLWSTVRQSILNHDDIFGFHHAEPWPAHPPVRWKAEHFHVGSNAGFTILAGPSAKNDGETETVVLKIEGNAWRYMANVRQGQWKLPVPFFLADDFRSGKLQVDVVTRR
ncbi:Ig-like domain-containing protein [Enterobacter sp. 9-2]|uniref:Ig-like domain-containing protein n=1 Tax=Enterobacter sp. 9-2 TaxID=559106 RepID=UPI0039838828